MLKNILKILLLYRPALNPIIRFSTANIGNSVRINSLKRETKLIISLYADEDSFDEVELTLYSIFNQSVFADHIILWISNEYELSELPYSITKYIKNGLDIKFIEDKGDYTQLIYALKEFMTSINVIAEAGIIYPKNWLEKLYHSYITNPEDINVHTAININIENSAITSLKKWERYADEECAAYNFFPIAAGGILYPPNCFVWDFFREDIYKKKTNTSADIWVWVMAIISNRKIRIVKNHIKSFSCTKLYTKLKNEFFRLIHFSIYDDMICRLLEFYRQNINKKLNLK